jgi:hypothetical protein
MMIILDEKLSKFIKQPIRFVLDTFSSQYVMFRQVFSPIRFVQKRFVLVSHRPALSDVDYTLTIS